MPVRCGVSVTTWSTVFLNKQVRTTKRNVKKRQRKSKKLLGNEEIKYKSASWKSFGMYNFSIKFIMIL